MGMPCRHIAAVCQSNDSILGKDPTGFPLSSIRVFWWNKYYLYGMSKRPDHRKSREALIALAANDTQGLPCPGRLDNPLTFLCPDQVFVSYSKPATDRLLNYTSFDAMGAVQLMRDRNNPLHLTQDVPAGLSQLSYLPADDGEWDYPIEQLSDTDDYNDSRKVLSLHYNDLSEAFTNSKDKESLELEFKDVMNAFIVRARGTAVVPTSSMVGQRVSMLPASSRKRKTHGANRS
jgi:hypothetical protein